MKIKPKFVVVIPVEKKTGNKAPGISTSITYTDIGTLTDQDKKRAIEEAKTLSRLGDLKEWNFVIKESSDTETRRVK